MTQDEIRVVRQIAEQARDAAIAAAAAGAADVLRFLAQQCDHSRRASVRVLGRSVTECCDCGAELTPTPALNLYAAVVEEDDTDNDADAWEMGGG